MTSATLSERSWTSGVHRRVLENGLTVLVQSDLDAPAVAVVIHVKAGFFDEPDEWQGISHVLEHMFFKGTPTRGVGQIASETKALGGYLNAATAYDWTSYYVVLPAEGFRKALAIQADALRNAAIDRDELARELKVIIEEAKRKLDTPSALAAETLHEILFDQHRIRRWRIGTEDVLSGFRREDVAGYYASRYVPSRTVISVVGAVDPADAFAAVGESFGDWIPGPVAVPPGPTEPWRSEVRSRTLRGDVSQADLVVGWRGVPNLHADTIALDLAALVLSSGRGSWLWQALRQPGIVTSAGAYHYSPSEVGVFSISADLDPDRVTEAVGTIGRLIRRLREVGPSEADLDRAKTLLTAQMARRFESVDTRASAFASAEALGGLDRIDAEYREVMATSADRVREAAARYLTPDAVAAVVYLPRDRGDDLTPDALRELIGAGTGVDAERSADAPPIVAPTGRRKVNRGGNSLVTHVALPGVDLLLRRKASVPLVSLGVFRRRQIDEPTDQAGIGALALRSTARGAAGLDARQLAHQFERLGGGLGTSIAADWFGVSTSVLAGEYPRAAKLLLDVVTAPTFDPGEVARERDLLLNEAIQVADDMFRRPLDLALGGAFGDRGYGVPVKGQPDTLRRLTADLVVNWHRGELATGRTLVVAVGQLDLDEAAERLAAVFGDLPARTGLAPASIPFSMVPGAAPRIETRAKAQSAIAMLFPGPDRHDSERHAAEVLSAVASGLGGRLFHALRDQRSLAYTVVMSSWQRSRAGGLVTYIATSPDREEEARTAMLEELAKFGAEGVGEDEWQRAVNYLAGQALVQRQTAGAWLGEIVDAWLIGSGLEELSDPAAAYRAVTPDAVRQVAARYLDPKARAEGVIRGTRSS